MPNRIPLIGGVMLALLAAGLGWWIFRSTPNEAQIQAAVQQPPALPQVNIGALADTGLTEKTVNGALPIQVDRSTLGRDDPFAGT